LKEGKLKYGDTLLIQFPKGIFEDFLYYIFNNVDPLTFLFASEKHPQPMVSRFVTYTTAQTFALLIFLIFEDDTTQQIVDYLFTPFILVIQYWLHLMLVCPCLPEVPKETHQEHPQEADNNGELVRSESGPDSVTMQHKGDMPSTSEQEWIEWTAEGGRRQGNGKPGQAQQSKVAVTANKAICHTIRAVGWFSALPIFFVLIILLVAVATQLADRSIKDHLIGKFIVEGILSPFAVQLLLASVNYFWFIHPTHLVVCGIKVLTINSWTESQTNEYLLHRNSILTDEELNLQEKARLQAISKEIDLCHCSCQCVQCNHRDGHYTLKICNPSCYITRCCDGISAWYREEVEEMNYLLPTPVRHSMSSTSPALPTEVGVIIREDDL
jgi:hypothetical protein